MGPAWHRLIFDHMYKSTCRIFGERVTEFWTMSYSFFDRNEPRGFDSQSTFTGCRISWAHFYRHLSFSNNYLSICKLNYMTLSRTLQLASQKFDMGSKKINGHHIARQNLMENPKIIVLRLDNFYFAPNTDLKKNDS